MVEILTLNCNFEGILSATYKELEQSSKKLWTIYNASFLVFMATIGFFMKFPLFCSLKTTVGAKLKFWFYDTIYQV